MINVINLFTGNVLTPTMRDIYIEIQNTINKCLETAMEQVLKRDWYYEDIENFFIATTMTSKGTKYHIYFRIDGSTILVGDIEVVIDIEKESYVQFTPSSGLLVLPKKDHNPKDYGRHYIIGHDVEIHPDADLSLCFNAATKLPDK